MVSSITKRALNPFRSFAISFVFASVIAAGSGMPASAQEIGSRVMCSPFSMPNDYYPGTVLMKEGNAMLVRLDPRPNHTGNEIYKVQTQYIKPGTGLRPANWAVVSDNDRSYYGIKSKAELESMVSGDGLTASAADSNSGTPASGGSTSWSTKTHNAYEGNSYKTAGMGSKSYMPAASKAITGKGTPPSGLYECNKISGSMYIHIGTLEIKGNTYRGFANEGSFHPYSMDGAGAITWTAGLSGLPEGWKLEKANYNGLDTTGHPWIQIRYVSPRNAHETVDAIKEK